MRMFRDNVFNPPFDGGSQIYFLETEHEVDGAYGNPDRLLWSERTGMGKKTSHYQWTHERRILAEEMNRPRPVVRVWVSGG